MGRRKIGVKCRKNTITRARQMSFSNRIADLFKTADAFAKLCNAEVVIFFNSPSGKFYIFGSPNFKSVLGRYVNPYPSASLSDQAKLVKIKVKIDQSREELERVKEHAKALKKKEEEAFKKNMEEEIKDLNLEELIAMKEKVEALQDKVESKIAVMEDSAMLSTNQKKM